MSKTKLKPKIIIESNHRVGIEAIQRQSNLLLIPIYIDWINKYLIKSKYNPINDLSSDIQNPQILINIIIATTAENNPESFDNLIKAFNSNSKLDCITKCFQYLLEIGVNVSGIEKEGILKGDLISILSLLYSLSNYKQQQKRFKLTNYSKIENNNTSTSSFKPKTMPPNNGTQIAIPNRTSNLRIPQKPLSAATSSLPAIKSRLAPPTKILSTTSQKESSTKFQQTTGIPSSFTKLPQTAKASVASNSKIIQKSKDIKQKTSIPSTSNQSPTKISSTTVSQKHDSTQLNTSTSSTTKLLKPPSTTKILQKSPVSNLKSIQSKNINSDKFSEEKTKNKSNDKIMNRIEPKNNDSKLKTKIGLKPPLASLDKIKKLSKKSLDSCKMNNDLSSNIEDSGISSKNDENDDDLNSSILVSPKNHKMFTSPSTSKMLNNEDKPTTSDTVKMIDDEEQLQKTNLNKTLNDNKPTLAVKGVTMRTCQNKPLNVGVVSPIVSSESTSNSKIILQQQEKNDLNEDKNDENNQEETIIAMKPLDIQRLSLNNKNDANYEYSSPTTINENLVITKTRKSEGESLVYPDTSMKNNFYLYPSKNKMNQNITLSTPKIKKINHNKKPQIQRDYSDSFEDSSSISSGISENFDDLSTDDISSGCELNTMAATTFKSASSSDYRNSNKNYSKLPNPLPLTHQKNNILPQRFSNDLKTKNYSPLFSKLELKNEEIYHDYADDNNHYSTTPSHQYNDKINSSKQMMNSKSAQSSPYHSQSLDRHGHLKYFTNSTAPNSPYRLSIAPQQTTNKLVNNKNNYDEYYNRRQIASGSISARSESTEIYSNYHSLQLHRLGSIKSSKTNHLKSNLSLQSNDEKYEYEIQKLQYEIQHYRNTISKLNVKHQNYNQLISMFDSKLQMLVSYVNKLHHKSQIKNDEVEKLKSQIEYLRSFSSCSNNEPKSVIIEGVGEFLRYPSMESVNSCISSMSSTSKTSKNAKHAGIKNGKKSWTVNMDNQIRSSFSKVLNKKKGKKDQDSESDVQSLNEWKQNTEVVELKKELKSKEEMLTDIRLDALDKAREVDILRETVTRLANENKALKRNCSLLAKRMDTRASSGLSLSTNQDDDPTYDPLPTTTTESSSHMSERSFSSTSSKRSSTGLATRVCISLEPSGTLEFSHNNHELTIGYLPPPTITTTWENIDEQLKLMLKSYLYRIELESTLGINIDKTIIGYKVGSDIIRDKIQNIYPKSNPIDVITPTITLRIRLQGINQHSLDGVIIESLFSKPILEQLIRILEQTKNLIINGARGLGKSNLAKTLAKYYSIKLNKNGKPENIIDLKFPDDDNDDKFIKFQQNLQSMLKTNVNSVILIDNVNKKFIPNLIKIFKILKNNNDLSSSYIICTINGALQRHIEEIQTFNSFRIFQLTNHMDSVKSFMGRYLRRRIAEAELNGQCKCSEQLNIVIDFLNKTLNIINIFIEKANAIDETIGPRTFLQCPLSMDTSANWFIRLWNENLVPYMIKVAKEGMILGCKGQLIDPTTYIIDNWPWPEVDTNLLKHVIIETNNKSSEYDPIRALERIEQSKKIQNHNTVE